MQSNNARVKQKAGNAVTCMTMGRSKFSLQRTWYCLEGDTAALTWTQSEEQCASGPVFKRSIAWICQTEVPIRLKEWEENLNAIEEF